MPLRRWVVIAMLSGMLAASVLLWPPIILPVLQIPLTLQVLMVALIGYLLRPLDAFLCVLIYVLIGVIGIPVFSGGQAGLSAILGPTGGFILTFPLVALGIARFKSKENKWGVNVFVGMIFIVGVLYPIGTLWLSVYLKATYGATWMAMLVFLIPDAIKIGFAALLAKRINPLIQS